MLGVRIHGGVQCVAYPHVSSLQVGWSVLLALLHPDDFEHHHVAVLDR